MSEIMARLTILSDSLPVAILASLLEVPPVESWPIGFVPRVGVKRKSAGVTFAVPIEAGEVQLERLLAQASVAKIKGHGDDLYIELSVVGYVSVTGGVALTPTSVGLLAELHASIDIDLYAV